MSSAASVLPPRSCSGAMYAKVPTCSVACRPSRGGSSAAAAAAGSVAGDSKYRAHPKSASWTWTRSAPSLAATMRFSNLMSRWTTPKPWRNSTAARTCPAMSAAPLSVSSARAARSCERTSRSVPPSQRPKIMWQCEPEPVKTSRHGTMCACRGSRECTSSSRSTRAARMAARPPAVAAAAEIFSAETACASFVSHRGLRRSMNLQARRTPSDFRVTT
mmetsp:Transcript_8493/g.27970  ORF Transcript_8493/g.27970 Transcript_8493/m.27970 type:complete len:218 (+) Transcript_8493:1504-2157(+)